jgi:hypothetical protein
MFDSAVERRKWDLSLMKIQLAIDDDAAQYTEEYTSAERNSWINFNEMARWSPWFRFYHYC